MMSRVPVHNATTSCVSWMLDFSICHRRRQCFIILAAYMTLQGLSFYLPLNIFNRDQAALWMVQSVRPSVPPSARLSVTPFSLISHHWIIMNFQELLPMTEVMSMQGQIKGSDQRSKVKVTDVKTPFSCFGTITPVWIQIWWWNIARS